MCAAARRLLRRHEPEHETAVLPARDVRWSEACPTAASSGGTCSGCGFRRARPAASVLVTSSNYRTTLAGLHVVRAASRLSYRGEDRGPVRLQSVLTTAISRPGDVGDTRAAMAAGSTAVCDQQTAEGAGRRSRGVQRLGRD
jgi:hypothetical protein